MREKGAQEDQYTKGQTAGGRRTGRRQLGRKKARKD